MAKTIWVSRILKFLQQLTEEHGDVRCGKADADGIITVVIKYDKRSDEIIMS